MHKVAKPALVVTSVVVAGSALAACGGASPQALQAEQTALKQLTPHQRTLAADFKTCATDQLGTGITDQIAFAKTLKEQSGRQAAETNLINCTLTAYGGEGTKVSPALVAEAKAGASKAFGDAAEHWAIDEHLSGGLPQLFIEAEVPVAKALDRAVE